MAKKVLKFGGTSVGTIERILHVAEIIKKEYAAGNEVIAIVSAMSGKTNELLKISTTISPNFSKRELDVLLTSGEQVASALLTGALIELGIIKPGIEIYDSKKEIYAKVRVDGSVKYKQNEGSIHKVAAQILGSESCNGWTYWHYQSGNSLKPIDDLRQRLRLRN